MRQADLIVVGAGSAGCVMASRLARQHGLRVTLVEPPSIEAPAIDHQRPARWLNLLGSSDDWNLQTQSSDRLAGRQLIWPRGRGLGGSSRINAMIWFPPTDHDLRMLVAASGGRWTLPELASAYELTRELIAPQQPLWLSEASRRFMQAARDLPDSTPMIYSRVNRQGRRWNPASLLGRGDGECQRVEVVRAAVDRIVWDRDRAVGVRVARGGSSSQLVSRHGVVLCGGTIATPTILMRSGIGPQDELARHKIDVRCAHPSVGAHLQDHLIMPVIFETKSTDVFTLNASVRDTARWQTIGAGPIGSNVAESGGLFSNAAVQIHITPTNYLTFPNESVASVMTVGVNLTQPRSRGSVTVASKELQIPPCIRPNYLADESDLAGTIEAVQLARRIAFETCFAEWIAREVLPGPKRESDASIAKSIARYAQTLYHPAGTCRMGPQTDSVVDSEFALRGTEGLWIADASVLPRLTHGNPNATVMTLATLAADAVKRQIETQD